MSGIDVDGGSYNFDRANTGGSADVGERIKTGSATMTDASEKPARLPPITLHYKAGSSGTMQHGLIAEGVAVLCAELVTRGASGKTQGFHHAELTPILVNVLQEERATIATRVRKHAADARKIASLKQQLAGIHAAPAAACYVT